MAPPKDPTKPKAPAKAKAASSTPPPPADPPAGDPPADPAGDPPAGDPPADPPADPQVEIAPGATVLAAVVPEPVPVPALYGFEEEPPRECTIILDDEPAPQPSLVDDGPAPGVFAGVGIDFISTADGEWQVDPDTGLIIGPA